MLNGKDSKTGEKLDDELIANNPKTFLIAGEYTCTAGCFQDCHTDMSCNALWDMRHPQGYGLLFLRLAEKHT